MFSSELLARTQTLLAGLRQHGLTVVTAESCTGGLVAGLLSEIPGASDVLERGFVTYSNEAKVELLGVPRDLIDLHGAVSGEVAAAMAEGALQRTRVDIAVAVTGIAGPGGATEGKAVGLVCIAAQRRGEPSVTRQYAFGDIGRSQVRLASVSAALSLIAEVAA
ncbi:MAG: damage-inducible protein CinA [Hyphomicrobium sp.]|nr:MAG: damage-inducible protein CinA [Hyphomicrobium sp.]PPC99683.1 MAG: damage-inducible protein CinA [Hyphomicrobium sp.]